MATAVVRTKRSFNTMSDDGVSGIRSTDPEVLISHANLGVNGNAAGEFDRPYCFAFLC